MQMRSEKARGFVLDFADVEALSNELEPADAMAVIATSTNASLVGMAIVAISLTLVAFVRKENKGYMSPDVVQKDDGFKVNFLKALIPVVPLVLLLRKPKGKIEVVHSE